MLVVLLVILIAFDIIINFKKKKFERFNIKEVIENENYFTKKIKNVITKNIYLKNINDKYVNKICLINNLSRNDNEKKIVTFLFLATFLSLFLSVLSLKIFTMWYAFIISFLLCMFSIIYIGVMFIGFKLNSIYALFPLAIQLFTDEYVTYKNIKLALNNSHNKMPSKISRVFENLARKFASENNYEIIINEFANKLDFVWGYAFAEILLLSYQGAGDISEELIYLNELTSEQIKSTLETETALSETKIVFLILNACTLIAFILNIFYVPLSKELYFYTQIGNLGILFWGISLISGLFTLTILKHI